MQIEFTMEQISILDRALQQMPYGMVAPMIASINKQLADQQKVMDTPILFEEKP